MPNWSIHLPRVGALVLSAAVAAGAYGVYTGQSSTSVTTTGEPVAGLPDFSANAGGGLPTDHGARPAHDRPAQGAAAAAPKASAPLRGVPDIHAVARDVSQSVPPQATPPPSTANPGGDDPGGDDALDRELQRVIDNEGPAAPKRPPADGKPIDGDPSVDAPVDLLDDPGVPQPDTGTSPEVPEAPPAAPEPPAATPAPPATPASPADPETPASPAVPETPASPAVPADPDSGLDDSAAGGLDQSDLGTPVDETDQAASAPPADAAPSVSG
jgi:hypothetical protein